VPPTSGSVPFSETDAVTVEQPPIAGDGGHCVADMGTSTTTHAGDEHNYRRSSNIVYRMKKEPRLRKPSRVQGSPYRNPLRRTKVWKKGLKSTAIINTSSGDRSPSTVHRDVVNDEDVISMEPIAVVRREGEVDAHAVPNAALKVSSAVRYLLPAVAHKPQVLEHVTITMGAYDYVVLGYGVG